MPSGDLADRAGGGVSSGIPHFLRRGSARGPGGARSSGGPGLSRPCRRVPVPPLSYQSPGAQGPQCRSVGARPGNGRSAWGRGTPAEVGLSLAAAGGLPPRPISPHPALQTPVPNPSGAAPAVTGAASPWVRARAWLALRSVFPLLSGHQAPPRPIFSVPKATHLYTIPPPCPS